MGAVFSYSKSGGKPGGTTGLFQSLMGAVFSYSHADEWFSHWAEKFQSLMGAVFSYSLLGGCEMRDLTGVSIPDGCSVQL